MLRDLDFIIYTKSFWMEFSYPLYSSERVCVCVCVCVLERD